jgi:hypothetical protein
MRDTRVITAARSDLGRWFRYADIEMALNSWGNPTGEFGLCRYENIWESHDEAATRSTGNSYRQLLGYTATTTNFRRTRQNCPRT